MRADTVPVVGFNRYGEQLAQLLCPADADYWRGLSARNLARVVASRARAGHTARMTDTTPDAPEPTSSDADASATDQPDTVKVQQGDDLVELRGDEEVGRTQIVADAPEPSESSADADAEPTSSDTPSD